MASSTADLISVIIPVYNVENYLKQCIESVINQTYTNLEIILIDDGSTDLSGKICDEYAAQDSRIQVLHNTNQGVSEARNKGLQLAKGGYVAFVDSDDWIAEDMYENLLAAIVKTRADVAFGVTKRLSNQTYNHVPNNSLQVLTGDEILDAYIYPEHPNHIQKAVWDKLYRRDMVKNVEFIGKQGEDALFNLKVLAASEKVAFISHAMYFYRDDRSGNATSTRLAKRFISDTIPVSKSSIEILYGNNRPDLAFRQKYYLYQNMFLVYKRMYMENRLGNKEICEKIKKILADGKKDVIKAIAYKDSSIGYKVRAVVFFLTGRIV